MALAGAGINCKYNDQRSPSLNNGLSISEAGSKNTVLSDSFSKIKVKDNLL